MSRRHSKEEKLKQALMTLLLLASALPSSAQGLSQQITDQSVITLSRNGKSVTFSIPEARALYRRLMAEIDVKKPETAWMPPAMRERLYWLQNNAFIIVDPNLPKNWNSSSVTIQTSETMARANYCIIPTLGIQKKPCAYVYVSMVILDLRLKGLQQPDEKFRMHFALTLAHEAEHLKKGVEFFSPTISRETVEREEIRVWHKVIRDMAAPLRRSGKPLFDDYTQLDDLLLPCKYLLPCKPFENWVRQYKVAK